MKKISLYCLLMLSCFGLYSQNSEQATEFINKTHIALNKLQKEMIRTGDKNLAPGLKDAIKLQVAAIKSFRLGKLENAFSFSYQSRMVMVELFKAFNTSYADYFAPTAPDGQFINAGNRTKPYDGLLSSDEINKIDNADVSEPKKLSEFDINLN